MRDLQGQLGDLTTLVDKLHTDTDIEEFEKQLVSELTNLKSKKTILSPLYDMLEIQKGQITLREDLKRIDISEEKLKEARDMFDQLYDVKFGKQLVDYLALRYNFSASTFAGAYTNLLSNKIHADIADKINEVSENWHE